jgi:hypothetical protein
MQIIQTINQDYKLFHMHIQVLETLVKVIIDNNKAKLHYDVLKCESLFWHNMSETSSSIVRVRFNMSTLL